MNSIILALLCFYMTVGLVRSAANDTGNCVSGRIRFDKNRIFPLNNESALPGSVHNPNISLSQYDLTADYGINNYQILPNGTLNLKLTKQDNKAAQGVRISTLRYMLYGKITVRMKGIPLAGAITTFITMSDRKDEIDFETVGSRPDLVETNVFYKGILDFGTRGEKNKIGGRIDEYHEYTIDWTKDAIIWSVDGKVVRTYTSDSSKTQSSMIPAGEKAYPSTPSLVQISVWDASMSAPGTLNWSGGKIDWQDKKELTASFDYIDIQCYNQQMQPVQSWPSDLSARPLAPIPSTPRTALANFPAQNSFPATILPVNNSQTLAPLQASVPVPIYPGGPLSAPAPPPSAQVNNGVPSGSMQTGNGLNNDFKDIGGNTANPSMPAPAMAAPVANAPAPAVLPPQQPPVQAKMPVQVPPVLPPQQPPLQANLPAQLPPVSPMPPMSQQPPSTMPGPIMPAPAMQPGQQYPPRQGNRQNRDGHHRGRHGRHRRQRQNNPNNAQPQAGPWMPQQMPMQPQAGNMMGTSGRVPSWDTVVPQIPYNGPSSNGAALPPSQPAVAPPVIPAIRKRQLSEDGTDASNHNGLQETNSASKTMSATMTSSASVSTSMAASLTTSASAPLPTDDQTLNPQDAFGNPATRKNQLGSPSDTMTATVSSSGVIPSATMTASPLSGVVTASSSMTDASSAASSTATSTSSSITTSMFSLPPMSTVSASQSTSAIQASLTTTSAMPTTTGTASSISTTTTVMSTTVTHSTTAMTAKPSGAFSSVVPAFTIDPSMFRASAISSLKLSPHIMTSSLSILLILFLV